MHSIYKLAYDKQSTLVGKVLGSSRYLHISALCSELIELIEKLCKKYALEVQSINVIRIEKSCQKISLLSYEDFSHPFPGLKVSHTIDTVLLTCVTRTYGKNGNCPILHRKELLLLPNHRAYKQYKALTEQAEALGLFTHLHKIGYRKYWNTLIQHKGLTLQGHSFVKK